MKIRLLFFAALRELTQQSEREVQLPTGNWDVEHLLLHLQQVVAPQLEGRLGSVRVAVNECFVEPAHVLQNQDVVALIPPVAGG